MSERVRRASTYGWTTTETTLERFFVVVKSRSTSSARLDYQPLFREMSQRSLPKSRLDAWGEPLLISTNQKLACTNPSGINYMFWLRRYSLTRPVRGLQCFKVWNIQDCDNEKCSRSWKMGIVSFSTAWVRKLHWFSIWRQGQNTAFESIAIVIFSSYFANVRASKIPQDQLKVLLSLLLAKRGGRWGRLRAKAAELDFVDDSPGWFAGWIQTHIDHLTTNSSSYHLETSHRRFKHCYVISVFLKSVFLGCLMLFPRNY